MRKLERNTLFIVLSILVVIIGVGWIIYGLFIPIYTFHAVRQAHTAMVSYSLWKYGIDIENIRLFFGGPIGTVLPFELPFYDATVAIAYTIFGQNDMIAKLVSVLYSVIACIVFISLVKMLLPKLRYFFIVASLMIIPNWIYHSQTVQPEAVMIMISIILIFCNIKIYNNGNMSWIIILILFSVLGVCIKANQIFHLFLLPWTLYFFGNRNRKLIYVAIIQLAFCGIAAYFWTQVGVKWPNMSLDDIILLYFDLTRFFDLKSLGKAGFTIFFFLASPVVVFLNYFGLKRLKYLSAEWKALFSAYSAYFIVGYPMFSFHTFYLNSLIPFVALFTLKGLDQLLNTKELSKKFSYTLLISGVLSMFIWIAAMKLYFEFQTEQIVPAGEMVQKYCGVDKPIVVLDQSVRWSRAFPETRVLYAAKRFGWNIMTNNIENTKKILKEYKSQGAEYLVNLNYSSKFEPAIMQFLKSYRPSYEIFDPHELDLLLVESDEKNMISIWRIP